MSGNMSIHLPRVAPRYVAMLAAMALILTVLTSCFVNISSASASGTVSASTSVISDCFISLTPNSISFGAVTPGGNVPTNVLVTDKDPNGNVAANIIVSATAWSDGGSNSFGVSNTVWSPTTSGSYSGMSLTTTPVDTGIVIPTPSLVLPTTSNSVYFGLAVPASIAPTTYMQTITMTNSC